MTFFKPSKPLKIKHLTANARQETSYSNQRLKKTPKRKKENAADIQYKSTFENFDDIFEQNIDNDEQKISDDRKIFSGFDIKSAINDVELISSYDDEFKVFLVPDIETKSTKRYIPVILFLASFENGSAVLPCCSTCLGSRFNIQQYGFGRSTYDSVCSSPRLMSCLHVAYAVFFLLQNICPEILAEESEEVKLLLLEAATAQSQRSGWFLSKNQISDNGEFLIVHVSINGEISLFMKIFKSMKCLQKACRGTTSKQCEHLQLAGDPPFLPEPKCFVRENKTETFQKTLVYSKKLYKCTTETIFGTFDDQVLTSKRNLNPLIYLEKNFVIDNNTVMLYPEQDNCVTCCKSLKKRQSKNTSLIFVGNLCKKAIFFESYCENNQCSQHFFLHYVDGRKHSLINSSNIIAIGVEIISNFLLLYASTGLSMQSFWFSHAEKVLANMNTQDKDEAFHAIISMKHHFTNSVAGYLEICEYPVSMFKCCDDPKILLADGIVLSVRNERLPKFKKLWLSPETKEQKQKRDDWRFPQIELEFSVDFKSFLSPKKGLCKSMVKKIYKKTRNNAVKLVLMLSIQTAEAFPCCSNLHNSVCPRVRQFASILVKDISPACMIAPIRVHNSLLDAAKKFGMISKSQKEEIMIYSPLIFNLMSQILDLTEGTDELWSLFSVVIFDLIVQADKSTQDTKDNYTKISEKIYIESLKNEAPAIKNMEIVELMTSGVYFPGRPPFCQIPTFLIGGKQKNTCTKLAKNAASCAPGLLCVWCGEHKHCVGMEVLQNAEDPVSVHQLLVTRFKNLPEVFIYDNACNVLYSSLLRMPSSARNTLYLVDKWHIKGHKNCCSSLDANQYPKLLDGISTVLHEQKNSILSNLKYTAPMMRFRVYANLIRFTLMKLNFDEKRRARMLKKKGNLKRKHCLRNV